MSLAEEIAVRDLWNPYDFANPVDDHQVFAGRDEELRDIRYYLRLAGKAPRPINLVLTGPRSSGKTSLLNRIEFEAKERQYCVARIDLNESDTSPYTLFYKVYDAILFAAVCDGAFNGVNGQVFKNYRQTVDGPPRDADSGSSPLLFPRHLAATTQRQGGLSEPTLKADLSTISRETGKPVVLLFDECDVLGQSRVELEMLRNVFMNTPGYMLVFAGTPNLFPVMEEVFSPIIRQFKKVAVERFQNLSDTRACIENPLKKIGVDPQAVLKPNPYVLGIEVDQLSAGRPYEIQLLCHFMFKRIEEGDARNMAITLDVLDDVRAELENQDKGNDRPSVAALHKLSSQDFAHLQALTEFRGTIQQYAVRSVLFTDDQLDAATLERSFKRFESMQLLKQDDAGVVSFAGDQFDEVYARYFAAANETRLFVWPGRFETEVSELLINKLSRAGGAEGVLISTGGAEETKRRLNEALTLLIGDGDAAASSIADAATPLYNAILSSYQRGSLTLVSARLSVADIDVTAWMTLTDDQPGSFLHSPNLEDLSKRAESLDGKLEIEVFDKPLLPIEELLGRVEVLASPNQLEDFANDHFNFGFDAHQKGEFAQAATHFGYAHRLHPDPVYATAIAHAHLMTGDWSKAELSAVAARAFALKDTHDGEDGHQQYAYATYDLAVALAARGDTSSALNLLEEVEGLVHEEDNDPGYLAVPVTDGAGFAVELLSETRLVDALAHFKKWILGHASS